MDSWTQLVRRTAHRHDVADIELALLCGVSRSWFYRRTATEGWKAPNRRVRIAPGARPSVQQRLLTACLATTHLAAASGTTAAWLHGLRSRPPRTAAFVVAYGTRVPSVPRTAGRGARWLEPADVTKVGGVPTLRPAAMILSIAHLAPRTTRALLIDVVHGGLATTEQIAARIERAGPLVNRGMLLEACEDLGVRRIESVFHDDVVNELTRIGYHPTREATHLDTPDGRGVCSDVLLEDWAVAIEPEGDAYHRTRSQRRSDRRRAAQYAGTEYRVIPIDWRDWQEDRDAVLDAIDAAIAVQRRLGIGHDRPPPRRDR